VHAVIALTVLVITHFVNNVTLLESGGLIALPLDEAAFARVNRPLCIRNGCHSNPATVKAEDWQCAFCIHLRW